MFSEHDHIWMRRALALAKEAAACDEVPVGAVLVYHNAIIGEGYNRPIQTCDPSAHAEIIALREGAQALQNYRLTDTTLYVTLEPCLMCAGALTHARVQRVVYGADDFRFGAVESMVSIQTIPTNHKIIYEGGLLAETCSHVLTEFFKEKRA